MAGKVRASDSAIPGATDRGALVAFSRLAASAAEAPDTATLLLRGIEIVGEALPAVRAALAQHDPVTGSLALSMSTGTTPDRRDPLVRTLEILASSALGTGRTAIARDDADGLSIEWNGSREAIVAIGIPIPTGIVPSAALVAAVEAEASLSATDVLLLEGAAGIMGIAVERLRQRTALHENEALLRSTFDDAAIAMAIASLGGTLLRVNSVHADLLGYDVSELQGRTVSDIVHPDDRCVNEGTSNALLRGEVRFFHTERRLIHRNGSTIWAQISMSLLRDPSGDPCGYLAQMQDITHLREIEAERWRYDQEFRALVENASDIIARYDRDLRHVYINPAIEHLTGIPRDAFIGRTHAELDLPQEFAEHWRQQLRNALDEEREITAEIVFPTSPEARTFLTRLTPEEGPNGEVRSILAIARDITERRAQAERLQFQALHDALTGLPNRTLMLDRLQHALARSRRHRQPVALLFLDLDNFKTVNDTLGHAAGDQLLIQVARRLERSVRSEDTVSRFGGDEFAVLLPYVTDVNGALEVADRIINAISEPYEVGTQEARVTASIGVALSESPDDFPDELMHRADAAMYRAKTAEKNRFEVFDAAMQAEASGRLQRESDLREATERNEFLLHYQPTHNLASGEIVSVEALARWRHPERGIVSPVEFITLAEETNLIIPLGYWAIEAAAQQAQEWHAGTLGTAPLPVSVNISARQFRHSALLSEVRRALEETGIAPELLILEIGEGVVMNDSATAIPILDSLKALGVTICIDDFGTGFSSLAYLRRFPVDSIKIDRECVRDAGIDADKTAIVAAIIAMGRALGLRTIAEGVESREQAQRLLELGCNDAQGYYFSRPLPASEIQRLLSSTPQV
jgi:diguanylate cyclase (GGDEF)-like protein/PAS domain S-box-containing protein